jgi:hypothetical protein
VSSLTRRRFLRTASLGLPALGLLGTRSGALAGLPVSSGSLGRAQLRGLAVDAARLPEKSAYYRRLIDFCSEWKLNALLFRLTDDQGSMLRFPGHPELITHAHALTPDEAAGLARYGERRGVTLIPEVESFGHSRYITDTPKWAHLSDFEPGNPEKFAGLIPVSPETPALMGDLYREVARVFPGPYLHGGCDEVNWGGSELSRRALKTHSRAEIWATYLNSLDDICRGLNKQLIVWGDFVLHKEPEILPRLSKRVVVMDWQYGVTHPQPLLRAAHQAMTQGHRVIGAPAVITAGWGPRAGQKQLRNIDAYADAYGSLRNPASLGVIVTNWVPTRYLQRSLWDAFAYSAVALNQGSEVARTSAFRQLVERFYGASWSSKWQNAFSLYYRITPSRHGRAPDRQGTRLPVPWASEGDLSALLHSPAAPSPPFDELRSRLSALEPQVHRNLDDFRSFALSAEYLEAAYWRINMVREAAAMKDARARQTAIRSVVHRDRSLVKMLDEEWNVGRFPDSRGRLAPLVGLGPADQLLFRMRQAAEFSTKLADNADLFSTLRPSHFTDR